MMVLDKEWREDMVLHATKEKMEMGRSAKDKREERTCLTLSFVTELQHIL